MTSLRSRVLGAGAWTIAGTGLANIMRLGGNLIVTRLLIPEMFGVMAIVLTISTILNLMSDIGLHQCVLRHPRGNEKAFLDTVWSVQVIRGFILWICTLIIALLLWALGQFNVLPADSTYASTQLPMLLAVGGLSAVINGFHSTRYHTAVRDLEPRKVVALELSQQFTTIVMMILFAWMTGSIWAIVAAGLIGDAVFVALSFLLWPTHRNKWAWEREAIDDLVKFGKWLFLSSAIGVLGFNADRLMLAGFADANYMGLYSVALGLSGAASVIFDKLFASVVLPALTETARKTPDRLFDVYISVRRKIEPVIIVFCGCLFVLGPTVVNFLYDDRYIEAGQILSVLSLCMLITRYQISGLVYFAINKPEYIALLNAVRVVSSFTLIPLALYFGGLPWGLVAIALRDAPTVPVILWLNSRHGVNSMRDEIMMVLFFPFGLLVGWVFLKYLGGDLTIHSIILKKLNVF